MRTINPSLVRPALVATLALLVMTATPSVASAQVGIGGRIAWVTPDVNVEADRVRFFGGQIRLVSDRWGLEVALDHHSEEFPLINQKISETPIQASLLLRMGGGKVKPFLLGGPGWYRRKVSLLEGPGDADLVNTEFGWHAGGGLEVMIGRHFGIHGDYRYTFLDFNGDDDEDEDDDEGIIGRLLPGHRGSMWTFGATFYF